MASSDTELSEHISLRSSHEVEVEDFDTETRQDGDNLHFESYTNEPIANAKWIAKYRDDQTIEDERDTCYFKHAIIKPFPQIHGEISLLFDAK